jgi:hypothetical protein
MLTFRACNRLVAPVRVLLERRGQRQRYWKQWRGRKPVPGTYLFRAVQRVTLPRAMKTIDGAGKTGLIQVIQDAQVIVLESCFPGFIDELDCGLSDLRMVDLTLD